MIPETAFPRVMQRMRAGDPDAAEQIFGRHFSRLVALARSRSLDSARGKEDPEDVVQSVYRSFIRTDLSSPFVLADWEGLWATFAIIMVRKCSDRREYWGTAKRDPRRELSLSTTPDGMGVRERLERAPTPWEAAAFHETLDQVIAEFRPEQREVVEQILQGYDSATIAGRRGCSERTVKRVANRIVHLLREMDGQHQPG
jgi:RNA polymerase sigma factor (sigma-70 family)